MFDVGKDLEEVTGNKPRKRFRWLFAFVALIVLLGSGVAALFLGIKSWEGRLAPAQGYAHGDDLQAAAVGNGAAPAPAAEAERYSVKGTVYKTNDKPAFFAIVTVMGPGFRHTAYAPEGTFSFDGLPAGKYDLIARTPARVGTTTIGLGPEFNPPARKGKKKPAVEPPFETQIQLTAGNADPHPAAYYAARVKFASPEMENDFRMQCSACHSIGNPKTRRMRDVQEWKALLERMNAMGAQLENTSMRALPEILAEGLNGAPAKDLPFPPYPDHTLAGTKIREWTLGGKNASFQDIAITADGKIWAVDFNLDSIHSLDPATGVEQSWQLPDRGHPRGGILRAAVRPMGSDVARQAPRSIVAGQDGRLWIACALGNEIIAFDPATAKTQHWSLPAGGYSPNTLQVRGQDVWFTVALSNQLGHLDLKTDQIRLIDLPTSSWEQKVARRLTGAMLGLAAGQPQSDAQLKYHMSLLTSSGSRYLPLPEGLDVAADGSVWYTKLYDDRIGRYTPATGEIKEWQTSFHGPRRIQLDSQGKVWIPAFGSSTIVSFDPKTEKFDSFSLPLQKPLTDQPYTVAVDPRDGRIWVASTTMDVLYRFSPAKKRFELFPLPTRTVYLRDLAITPSGEVCTSYSNLPDKQMSDAQPKLMCLSAAT